MSDNKQEEEYFAQIEREKRAKIRAQLEEEEAERSLADRKERHYHKCGKCGGDMNAIAFRGVEIEVCPDCGAVLLDNGELETLAGKDQGGILANMFAFLSSD